VSEPRRCSLVARSRDAILGRPRDVRDPEIFHHVSLVAFLAWVGLGADGLSSSAYGPDEAYGGGSVQRGEHSPSREKARWNRERVLGGGSTHSVHPSA